MYSKRDYLYRVTESVTMSENGKSNTNTSKTEFSTENPLSAKTSANNYYLEMFSNYQNGKRFTNDELQNIIKYDLILSLIVYENNKEVVYSLNGIDDNVRNESLKFEKQFLFKR
ncbi:hypothetical protein ACTS9E_14560 [Empedobacter brevis]